MSDILYFTEENKENENYYTQDILNNSLNNSLSNNSLNNSLSDNSLNNSLPNNSLLEIISNRTNQKKRNHVGGKKIGEIWNYFKKGADLGKGNYEAEYNWCNEKWSRGCSKDMKIHLARNCEKHFDNTTSIPITKSNKIDQVLIKAWVYLDGWTFSRHDSIYNYIVTTSTRKEYLIKLKNYNIEKQTGIFMVKEIQKIMQNIEIEKFIAVVTDHRANLRVVRRIIHEKYLFILDLRCMAHVINLVASDFAKINSVKKIIFNCNSIIRFFKNLHATHDYYKKQLNIMKIKGEIQSYCKTR
ncbi:2239_t:CDS:2 [Diversispora eburnea]|uniref:2239_t:CDS:1 n=1 Tax=Diversispora eburnea TaxID=1213867 RepID=A0A9N9CD09_9GLOM|nr:2239_t:CDS:2 [Diversispora eburnea]